MNNSALIMMIASEVVITGLTIFFFYMVFKAPKREEPDSFTENDPEKNNK